VLHRHVLRPRRAVSLSDLLVRPSHSIMKQSYSCRERLTDGNSGLPPTLNADGFGMGWYAPDDEPGEVAAQPPAAPVAGGAAFHRVAAAAPLPEGASSAVYLRSKASLCTDTGASGAGLDGTAAAAVPLTSRERPAVYSSTSPAWNDVNLVRAVVSSRCAPLDWFVLATSLQHRAAASVRQVGFALGIWPRASRQPGVRGPHRQLPPVRIIEVPVDAQWPSGGVCVPAAAHLDAPVGRRPGVCAWDDRLRGALVGARWALLPMPR